MIFLLEQLIIIASLPLNKHNMRMEEITLELINHNEACTNLQGGDMWR